MAIRLSAPLDAITVLVQSRMIGRELDGQAWWCFVRGRSSRKFPPLLFLITLSFHLGSPAFFPSLSSFSLPSSFHSAVRIGGRRPEERAPVGFAT